MAKEEGEWEDRNGSVNDLMGGRCSDRVEKEKRQSKRTWERGNHFEATLNWNWRQCEALTRVGRCDTTKTSEVSVQSAEKRKKRRGQVECPQQSTNVNVLLKHVLLRRNTRTLLFAISGQRAGFRTQQAGRCIRRRNRIEAVVKALWVYAKKQSHPESSLVLEDLSAVGE